MKNILTFVILFLFTKITFAQPDVKMPYFSINDKRVDPISFMTLLPENIEELKLLKPENAKTYGKHASLHGAVIVKLKRTVKLFSLNDLLKLYYVDVEAKKLPAIFSYGFSTDRLPIKSPKIFQTTLTTIQSVGVKATNGKQEKYLFIVRKMVDDKWKSKFASEIEAIYKIFYDAANVYNPKQDVIIVGK
ncbi:MAG: hypothetical protein EOO87_09230 [Pedobacter sp.]|nr:MAG: hypothetical protein EOO87_09230 [Pedobacter sp.]